MRTIFNKYNILTIPIAVLIIPYLCGLTLFELYKFSNISYYRENMYLYLYYICSSILPIYVIKYLHSWSKITKKLIANRHNTKLDISQIKGRNFSLFILISTFLQYYIFILFCILCYWSIFQIIPINEHNNYYNYFFNLKIQLHIILLILLISTSTFSSLLSVRRNIYNFFYFLITMKNFLDINYYNFEVNNGAKDFDLSNVYNFTIISNIIIILLYVLDSFIIYLRINNSISDWSMPLPSRNEASQYLNLILLILSLFSFFFAFYLGFN